MTTRPRIGYVLKMFPRFSETFILSELLELERQGTEIEVFSLRSPTDAGVHRDVGRLRARVRYVPQPTWANAAALIQAHLRVARTRPRTYLPAAWRARRRRGSWRHFVQAGWIAAHMRPARIEHLHAHFASMATSVAIHVATLSGASFSFTAHAKDIFIDGVEQGDLRRKIGAARFAVTISDYNLRHLTPLDGRGTLVRIYNGLDLVQFAFSDRDAVRGEVSLDSEPPLILAVGRLIEKKGFADLIGACAVLRDRGIAFECRIVGSGEGEAALQRLLDELDLHARVYLDGPMPREDLVELLPRASAFAAPCVVGSDGNRDGLPTVLVEAMARGVPVVATDVTGIPELVHHGRTGLIVPQFDPHALADALERLLVDRSLAHRLAMAAREIVEARFDLRRNVAQLRSLLLESAVAR